MASEMVENTSLWKTAFGQQPPTDPHKEFRARLRQSFISFRQNAEDVANEIPIGIRELTVHDVPRHIDALWQYADLLLGERSNLNPAEVYVLGGAFLLHDLGLALASYPSGIEDLKNLSIWRDTAAITFRQRFSRSPTNDELLNLEHDISSTVLESVLRQNHANAARTLAFNEYAKSTSDAKYHLIEDADLRSTYADLIGRIAYSHWLPVDQLADEFKTPVGAFPGASPDWHVDSLRLACILRTADACHIDARRAPGFLRALRRPSGVADKHWRFQEYVQMPVPRSGLLHYSVSRPIPIGDADAWWIGYELIQLADRELRDVDLLLRDTGRDPLLLSGVAGSGDTVRLRRYIRTQGWEPVNTEVGVSDVASLVRKLGGKELYGDNARVPLRELIQNARDAIAARRAEENRNSDWGAIRVRLIDDGGQESIEVQDCGVGMSQRLLTGPFLDFGVSYWHTPLMVEEHPGLAATNFEPQGRFGIGFYSVFMWGERVSIITRSIRDSREGTRVLEFGNGLSSRPLLRRAEEDEELADPGTTVRVWLKRNAREKGGLLAKHSFSAKDGRRSEERDWSLAELCEWLCPLSDVSIEIDENGRTSHPVIANDWLSIGAEKLLYRLMLHSVKDDRICRTKQFKTLAARLRPFSLPSGECVGRGALTLDHMPHYEQKDLPIPFCHTTAGCFRGWDNQWSEIAGVLLGKPTTASRVPSDALAYDRLDVCGQWATEQARLIAKESLDPVTQCQFALEVRGLGGSTGDLIIARDERDLCSFKTIAARSDFPDQIELHSELWLDANRQLRPLSNGQIGVSMGAMGGGARGHEKPDPQNRSSHATWLTYWVSLWGAVIEAIALAWNVPLDEVLNASDVRGGHQMGTGKDRRTILVTPDIIRNPRATSH
jgi:hypothetical protein